ncbi:MAG: histidine--tRNA ligase [Phycisphaerae bacterium]
MKIQSPPGMRDFYPEDMRLQNWLFEAWRRVSRAFGFSEYEGPTFEFLDLYTLKSGEGIVSELFAFQDRGERHFAIRPEMTPTLARMVAARANALPRPIKWFSIPRMCRAEKPQRGRLREFYQWNIDILGVDDALADAEVIAVAVEFFREIGLEHNDVVVDLNSRELAGAFLEGIGIAHHKLDRAFELIDRFERLPREEFRQAWDAEFAPAVRSAKILSSYLERDIPLHEYSDPESARAEHDRAAREHFWKLWNNLENLGVREFVRINQKLVRGLAYYTGSVFEICAARAGLRALAGGGRYDDLTSLLDGPRVPGVGFGMGDAPVLELLRALDKLPELDDELDVYVIDADRQLFTTALDLVANLRRQRLLVDFSYKRAPVAKQFRQAAARGARYAVVLGAEYTQRQELTIKNLTTGRQQAVRASRFLKHPTSVLQTV